MPIVWEQIPQRVLDMIAKAVGSGTSLDTVFLATHGPQVAEQWVTTPYGVLRIREDPQIPPNGYFLFPVAAATPALRAPVVDRKTWYTDVDHVRCLRWALGPDYQWLPMMEWPPVITRRTGLEVRGTDEADATLQRLWERWQALGRPRPEEERPPEGTDPLESPPPARGDRAWGQGGEGDPQR